MTRLARTLRDDDSGLTLVELMVAMLAAAIVSAVMMQWLITVTRTDEYEQEASIALEEMRVAKGRLIKEMRFADTVELSLSDEHTVELWTDLNDDDSAQVGIGEYVTWRIKPEGTLTREGDDNPGFEDVHASRLVYDLAAGPDTSRFTFDPSGTSVTIELVADIDGADGPDPKRIRTEVHLRNA